jgi:hypothetical protein
LKVSVIVIMPKAMVRFSILVRIRLRFSFGVRFCINVRVRDKVRVELF